MNKNKTYSPEVERIRERAKQARQEQLDDRYKAFVDSFYREKIFGTGLGEVNSAVNVVRLAIEDFVKSPVKESRSVFRSSIEKLIRVSSKYIENNPDNDDDDDK